MAFDAKGTVNKVILIGRLGQEPELKYTPSGAAVLTLSVATNTQYKGQDGNMVENTEWNRVIVWRKLAEIIAQYAKKGSRVYVEGKLETRSWDDKDGKKIYTTEIQAENIHLLDSKQEQSGQSTPPEPEAPPMDDELGF
jgi:single-strand DNA-binding protein